jgi:hypothetical protein
MNNLSYILINEILKDNTTLIFGGGFKPPTKGHLEVVKQSLKKYPQVNKYIIFVGSGVRDGITQQQSVDIWNIYAKYLPINIDVIPVSSPIKSVIDYAKEHPDENIVWIIGGRQGDKEDESEFIRRSKTIDKYPNITASNIITPIFNISGTKARQALKSGNKSEVITYFPPNISDQDIEKIIDIARTNLIKENIQKTGYRAGEFNPDYPAETLKDKGIGLTSSKVGLLGTGHYFFGSKKKAEKLKNKGKYNIISQIDLSSYKLFRPDDPVGFYENIKELTSYIHSLTKEDLKDQEVKEVIEDAAEGFSEYLNIPYGKTYKIIAEYISNIVNKKLDGPLLSNRLLYNYDGIDMTNTQLDDFSVGSLIFDKKLKSNTYKTISEKLNENTIPSINIHEKIEQLINFMREKGYNIDPLPEIILIDDDKSNAEDFFGKTAYYDPINKSIVLYTYGRHPKDVVRSLSHEMIHHIQNLENRLGNITTTNTQEDDHLNKIEAEANLKGTMTFRNWTDSLNESFYLDTHKFDQPKTIQQYLTEAINEISLSKENAVDINGDLTGGTFKVGDITYEYSIKNIPNPYKDLGLFYNIQFTPRGEVTSIPKGGKENYIKILSTMYKIIIDFIKKEQPEYIGISSLDNSGGKNYHTVYNNLTTNNLNLIPGYFRKDSNLTFDSPQGKGRFVVLKKKNNLQENKNKDPFGLNQYARELAQGLEENDIEDDGRSSPYGSGYKKIKEYTNKYKKYVLNELFEKDLPIIDKVSNNLYIVSNDDDIEAKYDIRLEIPERDLWSINWFFTPNNKNKSPEAWKQVTATSFRVLEDWLKTNNPKALYISGNTGAKTKLYKAYVDKLQTLLNNRYKIDNSDEDRVVLRSIEEIKKSSIKKRIETLNESYDQALNYFQNGDINSKSKIERWSSIKHKIERKVIKEMYKITEEQPQNYTIYCDMDGVIADFDKRFTDLSGMSPNQYEEKYGTEQFWNFIDNEIGVRFWVGIPWMKDGKQLWDYIKKYNPILLSAPSRNNESRLGKRLWVKKHIPGAKLILASRENKQNYAKPNSILIDDRADTIIEWENRGGIGILHTSAENTINKLKELGIHITK